MPYEAVPDPKVEAGAPDEEPPEDIAELRQALRRTGFSVQNIVASLNRILPTPNPTLTTTGTDDLAPPTYA